MGSEGVDSTLYNTLMDWLKGKKIRNYSEEGVG